MINNLKAFAVTLGLFVLSEITVGSYLRGILSTIERRFQLTSTTVAFISTSGQLGTLLVLPFISFVGSRYHRPRILAYGSVVLLCGLCFKILPHFIAGPYEYTDITDSNSTDVDTITDQLICNVFSESGRVPVSCDSKVHADSSGSSHVYYWMIFGSVLMGIGGAAVSPLGVSYIDDHTNRHDAAVYIGIMQSIALIGPVCGYLLGSFILKIWVDFLITDVSTLGVKPRDPAWVGAWWLGLAVCLLLLAVSSIPFWFFPKKMNLKNSSANQDSEGNSSETTAESEAAPRDAISFKEFFRALKRLFTNKLFVTIIILWTTKAFEISGSITFKTKYIEVAFGKSAAQSSLLVGAVTSPFLIIGTALGSVLVKCCKLNFLGTIRLVAITRVLMFGGYLIVINLGCTPTTHVGVDIPYPGHLSLSSDVLESYSEYGVNNTCNAGCYCHEKSYFPVCDDVTGSTYITPCHAGCSEYEMSSMGKIQNFTSCTCVEGLGKLTAGRCSVPEDCDSTLWMILGIFGFIFFMNGFSATASYLLLLRCIDPKDKAFALGIGILTVRIFGFIPAPLIFGNYIDQACSFWTQKECSTRNYCSIYDISLFRRNFITLLMLSVVAQFLLSIATECVGKELMKRKEEHSAQCEAADEKKRMLAQEEEEEEIYKRPETTL